MRLWPFFRTCEAGRFFFARFSHLSLNLSTDLTSHSSSIQKKEFAQHLHSSQPICEASNHSLRCSRNHFLEVQFGLLLGPLVKVFHHLRDGPRGSALRLAAVISSSLRDVAWFAAVSNTSKKSFLSGQPLSRTAISAWMLLSLARDPLS